ncbi:MAG: aminomethyl-transferring glycine dehydrogenase subunit GcvPA [Armatimonadetes bacterium]|nr:aminomethyl-transferring glycine dehydrogenase subunit GcvPA [Armatimonadota bacterium]PIU67385.1 MAG: aminomethyl-transferring glycine dehydrogenase [Armatimonadetes bacterium CG07_land_8_20_14_0_80_59_28]PIX39250.1 MAG: aminomethyl-transferring glycine dehydrogenase [Armatimonadetes bacterium CG_4_8_14_3_um_filter_58_9]PIY46547.1 MAG: aminomethyl-transferring glycine dehydrogenase [Armatimonadetes bacterium CG_4_10_14_3_um_filter_59_10]PJB77951.1 MAG: aminomethyl-transferring glycine dehyd
MRFLPNTETDRTAMLTAIGVSSIEDLFSDIPSKLRNASKLNLPEGLSEMELMNRLQSLAAQNSGANVCPTFLGAGSYDHFSPAVVRHVINRSEFLTSYTPFQPEVSQGTLQTIYEFQTAICALTGMEIANASMYDGASALAEAVIMATAISKRRNVLLPANLHPAYLAVVETYCRGLDVALRTVPYNGGVVDVALLERNVRDGSVAAIVIQNPNFFGCLEPVTTITEIAHRAGALLIAVVNPLSLGILKPPGEYGADIAVGDGQPLGIPMSFGGPTFGLFSCRKAFARHMPGRVAGATVDLDGNRGFVLTLQTREQHIRRERATSNICTSQQLLALAATVYLSAMGPKGLRRVADLCCRKAHYLYTKISSLDGYSGIFPAAFFNEFAVRCPVPADKINRSLKASNITGGYDLSRVCRESPNTMLLCVTEKRTRAEMDRLVELLAHCR